MRAVGRTFIIAEAGVNHGGSAETALALVDAAAEVGADAVKFQSFRTELLVHEDAPQAEYQRRNAPAASQAEMLRGLELSPDAHRLVAERCTNRGIEFLSTPFDPPSLDLLLELGVKQLKVASGELVNAPMLLRMARTGLPMIVSTGMATLDEVAEALAVIALGRGGSDDLPTAAALEDARQQVLRSSDSVGDVTLLHCTTSYPAPPSSVNLRAMVTLQERFSLPVGYSDHTEGTAVSVAAVSLGARIIEKHLTLDRTAAGPDHAASLEPEMFAELAAAIRTVDSSLGDGRKSPDEVETAVRHVARRSIHAARALDCEKPMTLDDLVALRPGGGLAPAEIWRLVGRRPSRAYRAGERLDE